MSHIYPSPPHHSKKESINMLMLSCQMHTHCNKVLNIYMYEIEQSISWQEKLKTNYCDDTLSYIYNHSAEIAKSIV